MIFARHVPASHAPRLALRVTGAWSSPNRNPVLETTLIGRDVNNPLNNV